MSIFDELKRRNVFRVGVAYIVAAWVFLQVADLVFDAINAPDWVLQSMLFLAVLGFIIAMIVAWAYEVTPEGIKREKEVVRDESITHQTAARLNKLTISLVLAGVTVVAVDRMIPEKEKGSGSITAEPVAQSSNTAGSVVIEPDPVVLTPDESSVAVLPFVNMSSDPEQEYFSDGISEEILNVLTRIPNLKVAANLVIPVQRANSGRCRHRAATQGQPRPRRQRAQGRRPAAYHGPVDRSRFGLSPVVRHL